MVEVWGRNGSFVGYVIMAKFGEWRGIESRELSIIGGTQFGRILQKLGLRGHLVVEKIREEGIEISVGEWRHN